MKDFKVSDLPGFTLEYLNKLLQGSKHTCALHQNIISANTYIGKF